jgi:NAD(P)-dependent dehydrogenase (short-subunit alcohol dehydrogenase family)
MERAHHLTAAEQNMKPEPLADDPAYRPGGKLLERRALITGGDSGIGRAVAVLFAKEGADVAIAYAENDRDAKETAELVQNHGRRCFTYKSDISRESNARKLVESAAKKLGGLDILVNNAGIQFPNDGFEKIKMKDMEQTFRTNIFAMFYLTQAALRHFKAGSAVINTASVTAYRGSEHLVDYSSTKGAIVAFTRSLALALVEKGIRVNAVAPGPIWTPLIAATFSSSEKAKFGKKTPMGRAGRPSEVAPCYVFLASNDSSYITGQIMHPNGGEVVNA